MSTANRFQGKQSRGFLLLEMMAVIDLILVLCSFSLPIYRNIIVRGRESG